ncbi:hypothetical protein B5M45_16930 [Mycobacterium simiae]|uniref:Pilin n=1 Tax=Mycobacterium simiae TaxID=1784 RepID=A0A1X0Y191_MYCSI|nr:hypothetical protein B5M45_16930 [Mycobacterium simiae]
MIAAALGLAGFGAATVTAAPGPAPEYHWCPGQSWDPGWGRNWDAGRCHDDFYADGEPHDALHWHGAGPWRP